MHILAHARVTARASIYVVTFCLWQYFPQTIWIVKMATQAKFPRTRRDAYKEIEVIVPRGRDRSYQSEWSPISHLQRQVTVAPTRMSASHATLASYDLTDSVDYKHVGILDVLCDVYSIGTFLFDVGSDIWLVSIYAHMGHWWWFGLTLACIVTSSVVSTFFSLVWYIQDNRFNKKHKLETASGLQWVVRISFTFLLMLPILRWVNTEYLHNWVNSTEISQFWYFWGRN